jgi:cobalt-zinc-cadmium resistance protein CzcA
MPTDLGPLDRLVAASLRHRALVIGLTLAFAALGLLAFQRMVFDAFPDLSNVQVQVLTTAPGLGAEEVERLVTLPVERSLGGAPGVAQVRSLSRPGVSAVSVIFDDGADPWWARQVVQEQLTVARAEIPPGAGVPQLGPRTTGLGEVYQFTLRSDDRSPAELYQLFQTRVAPALRAVPGVVEVNAWGAGSPELEVGLDPWALAARGLRADEVAAAVEAALYVRSGGDLSQGPERVGVRAVSNPAEPAALAELVLRADSSGVVRLGDVAQVRAGQPPAVGLGTADGEGEALFGVVQLLAGADALRTARAVKAAADALPARLPEDVRLETVYDREKLVGSTLQTVARSLTEGGLLVVLILLLTLGDLRAGLLVATTIPLSLLGAFLGLWLTGTSGNLMSLGAIDFGLVVDGTIVLVEGVVGLELARGGAATGALAEAIAGQARRLSRPILFAVGVLILVYLPVLGMVGTEGKLFRPMALTVVFALVTALVLTFTFIPALGSLILRPSGQHETALIRAVSGPHRRALVAALAHPARAAGGAALAIGLSLGLLPTLGLEFVPRLEEGDIVVQTARLPGISVDEARDAATRVEQALRAFPEVERVASRSGSPALATDPMGLEETDVLVRLAPRAAWTTAPDTEGLTAAFAAALARAAPGAAVGFTQPIEMRFSELLEGVPSDVGVEIYGDDLAALEAAGARVAAALAAVPGAADVKAPTLEGTPGVDFELDRAAVAAHGVDPAAPAELVELLQRGRPVGEVLRGPTRQAVVLRLDLPPGVGLRDLPLATPAGATLTLGDLGAVRAVDRPAVVRRQGGSRRVLVLANVRGRDPGGFVAEAREAVAQVPLPPGAWIAWSGEVEQLRAAGARAAVAIPSVLGLVFVVLVAAFGAWRPAALIFLTVPAAASGGALALAVRGMPVSMSAIVGFVALSGVAVMNGVVLLSRTQELHQEADAPEAARRSAIERLRPVLTTALVAGIGFVPMALSGGVGAEVQRPLATVVIGGLLTATPLTLLVLPSLYGRWLRGRAPGGAGGRSRRPSPAS